MSETSDVRHPGWPVSVGCQRQTVNPHTVFLTGSPYNQSSELEWLSAMEYRAGPKKGPQTHEHNFVKS